MDTLVINLEVIDKGKVVKLDGIEFSSCAFVRPIINGIDFLQTKEMLGSVLWFAALETSTIAGKHLIFTCACGIAEDAGWDYVDVKHTGDAISWLFTYDTNFNFSFPTKTYVSEIDRVKKQLALLDRTIEIVPQGVHLPD